MSCKLIIDTRERNVTRHAKEFESISFEIKQITTADYVVLAPGGNVLAAIERKSLEDFAASLKDGRSDNIGKLRKLKEETGCRLVYIIEGPAYPKPDDYFGNIAYLNIESSMFHLMIRDGVTIINTRDTLETAKALVRFVKSMNTLCKKDIVGTNDEPLQNVIEKHIAPEEMYSQLTKTHTKTIHEIAREMWSCFRGIAVTTADDYLRTWSIGDIVCEKIPRSQITAFKMSSGKTISKNVVNSLTGINAQTEIRMLACVPGVSLQTAKELLAECKLADLLTYSAGAISIRKVGKARKNLGEEKAKRILELFWYKTEKIEKTEKTEQPEKTEQTEKTETPKLSDTELAQVLNEFSI